MTTDLWQYRESIGFAAKGVDISGFEVRDRDGSPVGTVDSATNDVRTRYLVVHAGDWAPGRRLQVPAGIVERVDTSARQVVLDKTRDEVAGAPGPAPDEQSDAGFEDALSGYYRGLYGTGL